MTKPLLRRHAMLAFAAAALLALWLWCRPALRAHRESAEEDARGREMVEAMARVEARRRVLSGLSGELAAGRLTLPEAARRLDEYLAGEGAGAGVLSGRAFVAEGFPAPTTQESCARFLLAWARSEATGGPTGPSASLLARLEAELAEAYGSPGPKVLPGAPWPG